VLRIKRGGKLLDGTPDLVLEEGDTASFIASIDVHEMAQGKDFAELLDPDLLNYQVTTREIVVGRTLGELNMPSEYGCFAMGKVSVSGYELRIRELLAGDAQLSEWVQPLLEARRTLLEQFTRFEKAILQYVHHDDVCRRLMSIPGVGPFTALSFKTSIAGFSSASCRKGAPDGSKCPAGRKIEAGCFLSGDAPPAKRMATTSSRSARLALSTGSQVMAAPPEEIHLRPRREGCTYPRTRQRRSARGSSTTKKLRSCPSPRA